ncbi:peroxiredoxin [Vibrio crassostreae]|uniref:peroxiredoxin n=1 Tax=Vibrio crassostreae TaxID=246167 RepID=UPI001B318615|nr:peroxiredoxin [Vibrio crassostreae]
MLTINQKFPPFKLSSSLHGGELSTFEYKLGEDGQSVHINGKKENKGMYTVIFFYPLDHTFICPTEIQAFNELRKDFAKLGAEVLAVSTDSHFSHLSWRKADKRIKDIEFPMLADNSHVLSKALGILDEENGISLRATFVVDNKGLIRHVSVNDDSVGRNPQETLRFLDRLKEDGLCAACSLSDNKGEAIDLSGFMKPE